ncbi:hypothetical protein Malapachy_1954 [Malassezia pachydermatis]|uniref:Uncharacterized protein n=1 Tax=Malassezia pachydermatis TaxID=77020 RepID=A0A0M8MU05_9BASI|nr:hypothetical protein Malapachy_1954 [Malassezia pachydermatis]KOS13780.1 hypothetical protein Malapachy_1954 [Malassezia pachydermatis]
MTPAQGHARAHLLSLFGKQKDSASVQSGVDALLTQLSQTDEGDDDAVMALRTTLATQIQRICATTWSDTDLDAAVLALMLKHRDDQHRAAPMRTQPAWTRGSTAPSWNLRAPSFTPQKPGLAQAPVTPLVDEEEDDEFSPFARAPPLLPDPEPNPTMESFDFEEMEPVAYTPLDVFCSTLLAYNEGLYATEPDPFMRMVRASESIQHALERSNYDVGAALALLHDAHQQGKDVSAPSACNTAHPEEAPVRVCRFFLAGECRRSDCRFSHDLNRAFCRFWMRGQCLNDPCQFLHDYDALSTLAQNPEIAPKEVLSVPEAPPSPPPLPRPTWDASQTRWAAAAKAGLQATPPPVFRPSSTSSKTTMPARSARIPLRPPTLLPTLVTGSALAVDMAKVRASLPKTQDAWAATQALLLARHAPLRDRVLVGAGGDAGGWGGSAQASQEAGARGMRGRWIGQGLGVCLGVARPANVGASLSLDERVEAVLDLHGLTAKEACEASEQWLLALEAEKFRGLAYLCVGAGKHSARSQGKLAGQVRAFLEHWGYPFADYDGVIACDPCTHW